MRNDEKIDINLTVEGNTDSLSEDEIVRQNYETALRYINIAEHMKKFEDQDKYYHRAIQYLKKVRHLPDVKPLIRNLRRKKFNARARGKLTLYQEACRIRDKAKTPSEFYSAQTIFARIYNYEQKHPLSEKATDPDLYAQAIKCSDSEEQMKLCERLADEKAAQLKRHSFFVSCTFIVCIVALLFFTRTIYFRQCLAGIYSSSGDYEKTWQNYEYIYNKTGDTATHEKALNYRYKSALKALKANDDHTAYVNLRSLSKENYKDSTARFTTLEKEHIKNTKIGGKVSFAHMEWRVLDKQDGKVLLLKDNALGSTPFDETGKNTIWESSSVRKWLNGEFLTQNFSKEEQDNVLETSVKNTPNPTYNTSAGKNTTDKLFLLSCDEVTKYQDGIHKTDTCWWLRTPGASKNSMSFVYRDKTVMDYGYDVTNAKITVKPALWVNVE